VKPQKTVNVLPHSKTGYLQQAVCNLCVPSGATFNYLLYQGRGDFMCSQCNRIFSVKFTVSDAMPNDQALLSDIAQGERHSMKLTDQKIRECVSAMVSDKLIAPHKQDVFESFISRHFADEPQPDKTLDEVVEKS